MAKRLIDPTTVEDNRRPDIEAELTDKYHTSWEFLSNVSPAQFDQERSLHNQARFEPVDEKTVELYRGAVARGDRFPPVIAYRPHGRFVVIDGNHRLLAHAAENASLDVYDVAADTRPQTIALMTFAFNTRHGRPTSEAERISQAVYLVDNGASIDAAASAVNLAPRVLRRAMARTTADRRADEVGLLRREWESLSASGRARLATIATDEGFAAAARLAFAAKLDTAEMFELVGLVNATRSGTRQVAIVDAHRAALADRIQSAAGGVLTSNDRRGASPKARIGMAVGQLMALPADDSVIVAAYVGEERTAAAKRWREAADRLAALAARMEA